MLNELLQGALDLLGRASFRGCKAIVADETVGDLRIVEVFEDEDRLICRIPLVEGGGARPYEPEEIAGLIFYGAIVMSGLSEVAEEEIEIEIAGEEQADRGDHEEPDKEGFETLKLIAAQSLLWNLRTHGVEMDPERLLEIVMVSEEPADKPAEG